MGKKSIFWPKLPRLTVYIRQSIYPIFGCCRKQIGSTHLDTKEKPENYNQTQLRDKNLPIAAALAAVRLWPAEIATP